MEQERWKLIPLALLLCVAAILTRVIQQAYFTPLRKIPGPWHAKFTDVVLKKETVFGRRIYYIQSLHERYGSMVRIGPNEIDCADINGFKEIHRIGSGFTKSAWYTKMRSAPEEDVFSVRDPIAHAKVRKLFARPFSKTSLRQNWEAAVREKVIMTMDGILKDSAAQNGTVDVRKWFVMMAADVVSLLAFGESFDQLRNGKIFEPITILERLIQWSVIGAENSILFGIYAFFSSRLHKEAKEAVNLTLGYSAQAVKNARARNIGQTNLFGNAIAENEKGDGALTDAQIQVEAQGLLAAGSGTTSVTMTYLVWAVLKHPVVARRLEHEVAQLPEDYDDAMLEKLPYLNAVIDETLRLYGAAPGSLPRLPPPVGATICGYYIPAGTVVCSQAYSVHRNGDIFPNAQVFFPERWLDTEESDLVARERAASVPFGAGARTCLGLHLASIELRYATAEFFRRFPGSSLSSRMIDRDMELLNYFLVTPKGGEMLVDINH